ncbi:DNA helicase [Planomonospora parontospora subsp. parontospora]|uniref:DNA helicase n=2 Tax=Planomonospora parontospora TaxID=58119 RepID=A0AA37BN35_9ACTN|nr:ATP-binding domain-containing protein [Planomonospora parontospora]GGK95403.1 DNA helicase [Planomonospora parontospora]GII12581.1 DNA helicase [Planomonospora parontospora subsp. parontospora]
MHLYGPEYPISGKDNGATATRQIELAREQEYVTSLYERLDLLRDRTQRQLDGVLAQGGGGTHQNRSERDSFAGMYAERLARLWAVENGLCFGRLDNADHTSLYIGRIGLADDDQRRLLIDWRAPVAQPFYRATPASPMGVTRRRHLQTKGRKVIGVDDDLLDLDTLSDEDVATLNGEAALLASLGAHRTGRMRDIVATIQAEQDRIIRSDLSGVLVVQGGPGTGKTVVALHRAAYLLYTHREKLARRGVLILGPNLTFLRYIEQVLPSLGETDVLLSTVAELYPGITATAAERPETAAVKGDERMVQVVARAVRERQRVPRRPIEIKLDRYTLSLDGRTLEAARNRAARSRRPHNEARAVFVRHLLNALARQAAKLLGKGVIDDDELADLREELRTEQPVKAALNRLWPYTTPQQLLLGLFTSRERLEYAAAELSPAERALLLREPPRKGEGWWSPADVALLDEAAELLGEIDPGVLRAGAWMAEEEQAAARAAAREEDSMQLAYAKEVLELTGLSEIMDAEKFAARHLGDEFYLTTAERAAGDRTWAFGHIIVDEAQELSPMDWRMVMRRCPTRSMTIVGDLAQTASAAGARSWERVLDPYVGGRWRVENLSVNYRTPTELMAVAAAVLPLVGPGLTAPASVRETGERPWAASPLESLPEVVKAEIVEGGRLAVLVPESLRAELGEAVTRAVDGAVAGPGTAALDAPAAVLSVAEAKGLEFDTVIVVEPDRILGESPRGASDLYVALTRATRRLGVVHGAPLPAPLAGLERRGDG